MRSWYRSLWRTASEQCPPLCFALRSCSHETQSPVGACVGFVCVDCFAYACMCKCIDMCEKATVLDWVCKLWEGVDCFDGACMYVQVCWHVWESDCAWLSVQVVRGYWLVRMGDCLCLTVFCLCVLVWGCQLVWEVERLHAHTLVFEKKEKSVWVLYPFKAFPGLENSKGQTSDPFTSLLIFTRRSGKASFKTSSHLFLQSGLRGSSFLFCTATWTLHSSLSLQKATSLWPSLQWFC